MSVSRAALYRSLGLVDAPLPERTCGGCPTCRGDRSIQPVSYELAKGAVTDRLKTAEVERVAEYAQARDRMLRAAKEAERAQGHRAPTLAWTREATS